MKRLCNAAQMKAIDQYTIEKIGIPAIVLMERAALQVVACMMKHTDSLIDNKILAVCGTGNNGADGIAVARILYLHGYQVDILLLGEESKASAEAKQQINIAKNLGISIYNNIATNEYTIIIDAIFGIGLNKPVRGIYETVIKSINSEKHTVYSVDIPSGLSADTGKPLKVAVKADYTITFGLNKIGMIFYPGYEYAGEIVVADIGFPELAISAVNTRYFTYDSSDLVKLPPRYTYSNKGTYGKVLIIAGSKNMSGACYFSAKAAYRTGAGLVKVLTVEENREIIQTMLPEAIVSTYASNESVGKQDVETILSDIAWATAIVIGPGIGKSKKSAKILDLVVNNAKVPIVLDADAINIIAEKLETEANKLETLADYLPEQTILTPHLKELSGLLGIPLQEISDNLLETANKCTQGNKLIFTIKDARSIVAYENIRYINTSGNNGMATGGSGDVLTGIIASLIAQGLSPQEAAMLGVYLHGLAGDKALEKKGQYALIASDIIEALANVLR